MKRLFPILSLGLMLAGCAISTPLDVKVTPLEEKVAESREQHYYTLPQTVLKVDISYREMRHVPGPFRDYAEKYLSVKEVIWQNFSRWQIVDVDVSSHVEMDPELLYLLHVRKGDLPSAVLEDLMSKGLIMDPSSLVNAGIKSASLENESSRDVLAYRDMGIESNFQERTETMYKTIVTDTSFVEVPVNRTITEQKSLSMKAKEAADFLLELRTRRFELLTGEYDAYPQGVAMKATLDKLDELESSYLSLFTGKTLGKTSSVSFFIVPESGIEPSTYELGIFSEALGFVPAELQEGKPLLIRIEPLGKTKEIGAHYRVEPEESRINKLYYRLPDVVRLELLQGNDVLAEKRISVYQSGDIVAAPLPAH